MQRWSALAVRAGVLWMLDVQIVVTNVRGIVIHRCNIRVFEQEMRAQELCRATQQWSLRLLDESTLRSAVSTFGKWSRSAHLRSESVPSPCQHCAQRDYECERICPLIPLCGPRLKSMVSSSVL